MGSFSSCSAKQQQNTTKKSTTEQETVDEPSESPAKSPEISRDEVIVHAYIRKIEAIQNIVPLDLIKLLSLFCRHVDQWNTEHSTNSLHLDIHEDHVLATKQLWRNVRVFGDYILQNDDYCHWRIQIEGFISCVYIGIISDDEHLKEYDARLYDWKVNASIGYTFNCGYAFFDWNDGNDKIWDKIDYGKPCGDDGDVIEVIVDLSNKNRYIQFIVNGEDHGIANDRITTNCSYKLMVCLDTMDKGSKIKLL